MRYACLLRGINVSGLRKIAMKELVEVCKGIGLRNASSLLQSGNLLVESSLKAPQVETLLQDEICLRFSYADVDVIALTAKDLMEVISGLPEDWRTHDSSKLHITFFKSILVQASASNGGYAPDLYALRGKVAYVYCPDGYGRTKLNTRFFERLCKTRATTRNWSTTLKLQMLAVA
ncbi:DUF1697 domain-containing protein [Verminephrobacter aporrectodeae]|uniref:DUF1697 domain-containing protein n=1 Tax=Verminephrobacter aporrectodeae TaxID=1110389 RepID=UPI002238232A|nr:DUF1697 domain-containing protein [Verminephrobacter aporrectodeae]MCW5220391.1 DUF1697 domain-containing protein [Verminephrobacter aporrectodeae subsp. tuberculatae]MCW5289687.1 DUF1697 domain-containing protein [Verminephrobacter aporrectodeae subsp. tuberculatae]MCW8176334.1 DUF1697 domain-containing protein [Verminephrobacter aporrectodeae subsp. tuberculatae]MCW8204013.1 DUF1697 domain-containing protein [Verminephrobacter aporrectodeae subsp. tuberculatae]